MSKTYIPEGYKTPLEVYDMQCAIEFIKGNFHTFNPVQRVKYSEYIDSGGCTFLNKSSDYIVWIVLITYGICSSDKHLEKYVRNMISECSQSFPWVFLKESVCSIKCCSAPHFQ